MRADVPEATLKTRGVALVLRQIVLIQHEATLEFRHLTSRLRPCPPRTMRKFKMGRRVACMDNSDANALFASLFCYFLT